MAIWYFSVVENKQYFYISCWILSNYSTWHLYKRKHINTFFYELLYYCKTKAVNPFSPICSLVNGGWIHTVSCCDIHSLAHTKVCFYDDVNWWTAALTNHCLPTRTSTSLITGENVISPYEICLDCIWTGRTWLPANQRGEHAWQAFSPSNRKAEGGAYADSVSRCAL